MLVYGDPRFRKRLTTLCAGFSGRIANNDFSSLDDLRNLLIGAGQIEQGLADYCEQDGSQCASLLHQAMCLTDWIAGKFCQMYAGHAILAAGSLAADSLLPLNGGIQKEDPVLTIKIPEGFAFYALFPEQYYAAALAWSETHNDKGEVLVVGIRSIGTTLSAVVAEALKAIGRKAVRVTVRPGGHPFDRCIAQIPEAHRFSHAIVVDEGPGLSGSSMAAVATALRNACVGNISFFPGHGHEPGAKASREVREIWAGVPKYITPLPEIRWNGSSLKKCLCLKAQELTNCSEPLVVEDLSAGAWRSVTFDSEKEWPAVTAPFERMKFRCTSQSSGSVLWKFAGLGQVPNGLQTFEEAAMAEIGKRAQMGFAPKPLGFSRGFVAMEWSDGRPLRREDGNNRKTLSCLGKYIARAAKKPLSHAEAEEAKSRLAQMVYWNVEESFGEKLAEKTRVSSAGVEEPLPSYGDGHISPEEWLLTSSGRMLKTDCEGHDSDHTLIGRQSVLWDIAGALVEWDLSPEQTSSFFGVIHREGIHFDPQTLRFYKLAYAAFRMGLMFLSMGQTSDANERQRLKDAYHFYREHVQRLLTTPVIPLQNVH